jgi:hypothetical protein
MDMPHNTEAPIREGMLINGRRIDGGAEDF